MAEALLKNEVKKRGIKNVYVSSCGTSAMPSFQIPSIVVQLMAKEKIDISSHKPTQVNAGLVNNSDLILAMSKGHKEYIISRFQESQDKTYLFKEYLNEKGEQDIFDPIGQSDEVYKKTLSSLKKCIKKLIQMMEDKSE
ncbi:MAG: hypothetical protein JW871_04910 [Endomicrobiales bacterium]|nr:hypothetical protein [Endomicrobiales bacterium]